MADRPDGVARTAESIFTKSRRHKVKCRQSGESLRDIDNLLAMQVEWAAGAQSGDFWKTATRLEFGRHAERIADRQADKHADKPVGLHARSLLNSAIRAVVKVGAAICPI